MGELSGPGWLDRVAWRASLDDLGPRADVYFSPEYHELHERNGDGQARCFCVRDGDKLLLVPALRTPISDGIADLQTCNGYGGPLASAAADPPFLERAWTAWREAARADGIVAGLFRLHPVLRNRAWLPADAVIRRERQTVVVDVSRGADATLASADSRHRNMVNKARRAGAQVSWVGGDRWNDFVALYREAMVRLGARESLDFSDAYFSALRAYPAAELAVFDDERGLAAAAVFLWGPQLGHYHLAARRTDAPNFAASIVLQAAVESAVERGLSGIHLGGGTTSTPDDPLLKFKRSLGGQLVDFEVALVIADVAAYQQLVADWTARAGRSPTWLLGYRQPG